MKPILDTETLEKYINQNGVRPGPKKLEQFRKAIVLRGTPALYSQDGKGNDAVAYVKLFDPTGHFTWYLTESDGQDQSFGLICGHDTELGYVSLNELASVAGRMGIGIEIDIWFKPTTLKEIYRTLRR